MPNIVDADVFIRAKYDFENFDSAELCQIEQACCL